MDRQLENAYESVLRRNPGEAEFHQADFMWRALLATLDSLCFPTV